MMFSAFVALSLFSSSVRASRTAFSVHDDLLAFPQYEVSFSDTFISDVDADRIVSHYASLVGGEADGSSSTNLDAHQKDPNNAIFDHTHATYEILTLDDEQYFCTIPIVAAQVKNETLEAETRAAEEKELARATDRGWELLQDLGGNCLYYASGWWSYSFCYNNEVTQFHQVPPQPGKPPIPPTRDVNSKQFILGKARVAPQSTEDEWGNKISSHKGHKQGDPPKTELQVKGDSRYLVQHMEGGTTCDLTGRPRTVEVQYHCNPHVTDRIGYIKEVTTCTYQMIIYTPRLCTDAAFMPAKESKANQIICKAIVSEDDLEDRHELRMLENELDAVNAKSEKPINIGGIVVGGRKWVPKDGAKLPIPTNFGQADATKVVEVIAHAKPKSEGGQVETISEANLLEMDLDPKVVDKMKRELQKEAKDNGWEIKLINEPGGELRTLLGIVEEGDKDEEGEEGSQEVFKDEL